VQTGMDRQSVLARLNAAFEGSADDPLGAVLKELAILNEEAGLAAVAELLDAPDNQPSEQAQQLPEPRPEDTPIEEREWGGYDNNIYSNPENCGLEMIATAGEEPDYDFSIVLFLRDKASGRYFVAYDSGCSCPSPFEDHRSVSDLTEVTTRMEAIDFLNSVESRRGWSDHGVAIRTAFREILPEW
jgi:hypothetical protein